MSVRASFMGEFPSAVRSYSSSSSSTFEFTKVYILNVLEKIISLMKDGYELQRQKDSEVMVFLCCDLDRNWSKDQIRWSLVACIQKGYSLTTEVFRNIVENVHDECQSYGIHVPCESFNGQWHNIVVR